MTNHHNRPPRLPLTPGEVTSQGIGLAELDANIASAPPDQVFTHLLVQADILPDKFDGVRIIPAITYGVRSKKLDAGAVELLPGTDAMMHETFGTDFFNPHQVFKNRADNIIKSAKHPRQDKTSSFSLPSYLLGNQRDRHLFVGGNESDLEGLPEVYAVKLAEAYRLGSVVIGGEVMIGDIKVDFGKTSLPSLVREIGQTIAQERSGQARLSMIKHAKTNLSHGKSPDYSPWQSIRSSR